MILLSTGVYYLITKHRLIVCSDNYVGCIDCVDYAGYVGCIDCVDYAGYVGHTGCIGYVGFGSFVDWKA